MNRGTILYVLNYGSAVRNIVRGGVMQHLVDKGYDLVLCSVPEPHRDYILQHFSDRVRIEELDSSPIRGLARFLQRLRTYIWRSRVDYVELLAAYGSSMKLSYYWQQVLGFLLRCVPFRAWRWLSAYAAQSPQGEALLRKYQPVAVILSNPLADEASLIGCAQRRGIYTAGVLESWDNLTCHGALYCYPDDFIVWNELVRKQAITYHHYPPERVHAMGIPSFDLYSHPERYPDEAEWRRDNNLPPDGPVLVYSSASKFICDQEDLIIDHILKARENGLLPGNLHILVRYHPKDDCEVFKRFVGRPGISVQFPNMAFRRIQNDPAMDSPMMLAATMRYASVVLNVFSTTCIDALCNGTPVVVIGFDVKRVPYHGSVRKYLKFLHIEELMKFNAVLHSDNPDQMIEHIGRCLMDRNILMAERERCVQVEAHYPDGNAAGRVAEFLHQAIQKQTSGSTLT